MMVSERCSFRKRLNFGIIQTVSGQCPLEKEKSVALLPKNYNSPENSNSVPPHPRNTATDLNNLDTEYSINFLHL